ncbi:hypothetical protein TNCV_4793721 [Trichonephila clavipes]|nr:hypothetical protein TNCV_4793721 [Trichonephila clavipes]
MTIINYCKAPSGEHRERDISDDPESKIPSLKDYAVTEEGNGRLHAICRRTTIQMIMNVTNRIYGSVGKIIHKVLTALIKGVNKLDPTQLLASFQKQT